jgi:glycosyltransferase involved in cell wall biosynthesis
MRVSIVTISFNQGRFLPRAMTSVLSQDHPDVEYIVVDPGSSDSSRELIRSQASRIAHVVLEPDSGPPDGLNHGFAHATGNVLGYVNADDALLPGAVREAVAYLSANPDVDVVYGDGYLTAMSSVLSTRRHSIYDATATVT